MSAIFVPAVPPSRLVATSADLTGGGNLGIDRVIGLADPVADPSGTIVINNYSFTIDRKGRITNKSTSRNNIIFTYDFAVQGSLQSVPVNVTGFDEFFVVLDLLVNTAAVTRAIQVSVDGGFTYLTGAADYAGLGATGGLALASGILLATVTNASARDGYFHMKNISQTIVPKYGSANNTGSVWSVAASSLPITNIRLTGIAANIVAGLYTAGKIYVLAN
jgi:hypothetical protein